MRPRNGNFNGSNMSDGVWDKLHYTPVLFHLFHWDFTILGIKIKNLRFLRRGSEIFSIPASEESVEKWK